MTKNPLLILINFCLVPILTGCSVVSIFSPAPTPTLTPTPTPLPGSISGVVSWATKGVGNKVLVGFTVLVWDSNNENQSVGKGVTNGSGDFEILNIAPGTYIDIKQLHLLVSRSLKSAGF
jgi:hypothetical protein